MKINVLDKSVYNRIAAGEVVERPFSVVKELVENSVDAGATAITVSIWNGGKDRVCVEDDGCGIDKGELKKAFLPHATSKISGIDDLDRIMTLGFRGEALASIASVSKVTVVSKPENQEYGATVKAEGGVISEVEDAPCNKGTRITVDSLFYNTPVRAGFLKSSRAEEADITDMIDRLVIANPGVSFKFYADDKLVLQSYGGGAEEALISVYGASTVRNCLKISSEKNGIRIEGYIGKHNFTKPNRTYQTLVVNGRYVINATVSSAMQNAYRAYLMKRQYPFYALSLTVPTEAVDVNVHPNKTDVRFKNNQVVYGAVYSTVSKVLDGSDEALDIVMGESVPEQPVTSDAKCDKINYDKSDFGKSNSTYSDTEKDVYIGVEYGGMRDNFSLSRAVVMDSGYAKERKSEPAVDIFAENKKYIEELERKKAEAERAQAPSADTQAETSGAEKENAAVFWGETASAEQGNLGVGSDYIYIGQAFKTYLIFEKDDDLFFIDQHAAHERLIYDSLYSSALNGTVKTQPLLLPYVLELNVSENGYFLERREYLEKIGFRIEEFGVNSYKITEVPLEISDMNLGLFFADILSDNAFRQEKIPAIIIEKLCQRACKAAIKAGYSLSQEEIRALMAKINGNMGLKCPHGRPVAVRITNTEIKKWFKRIV